MRLTRAGGAVRSVDSIKCEPLDAEGAPMPAPKRPPPSPKAPAQASERRAAETGEAVVPPVMEASAERAAERPSEVAYGLGQCLIHHKCAPRARHGERRPKRSFPPATSGTWRRKPHFRASPRFAPRAHDSHA